MGKVVALVIFGLAVVSALPYDPVIRKLDDGLRYQYAEGPGGRLHLVDLWATVSDVAEAARYNPDRQNVYHLFTRQNPTVSQPLLVGSDGLLGMTNYNPNRRTIILIHGWLDSVTADFNTVLVPAFLEAEDVNVIVVDWSAGGGSINYFTAMANTVPSGESVARFINWLNGVSGAVPGMYHLVGHSLGGHQAGIAGRNVEGNIAYITALDPALPGWTGQNNDKFRSTDGVYTEVIHTNSGFLGYLATLGDADFYPNGGISMPGCNSNDCDHSRCFYYMAESLRTGGFNGRRCLSYATAMTGNCQLWGNLRMGGLVPKTGQNPTVSQPLLVGSDGLLGMTNYNPNRRTIILIHGWLDSVTADFNTVLVPAFLEAEDVNVIVVDWSAGGGSINYFTAMANTVPSGESVARFINWLNGVSGAVPGMYHLVGHSLGGHQAGIAGRNVEGNIAYITALDPALPGWTGQNNDKFRSTDGVYTEVIHTNSGFLGYLATLGDADFYPNGGISMPGCNSNDCDHSRCFYYMAESLRTGGFNGRRCLSYATAMTGNCQLWGNLRMGGLVPKTGQSGIYYLETNASPPFSRG